MWVHLLVFCRMYFSSLARWIHVRFCVCMFRDRRKSNDKQKYETAKKTSGIWRFVAVLTAVHPICIQTATCWKSKPELMALGFAYIVVIEIQWITGNEIHFNTPIQQRLVVQRNDVCTHRKIIWTKNAFRTLPTHIQMHPDLFTLAAISIYIKQPWANEKHAL